MMKRLVTALLALLLAFSPAAASSLSVYVGGAWHTVAGSYVYEGGAWHSVASCYVYVSGAWHQSCATLEVSANNVSDTETLDFGPTVLLGGVSTATVTGGSGSYTYAWTYVSGDAGIGISSATAQNPTLSKSVSCAPSNNCTADAVWQVVATDTVTTDTANTTISIHLEYDRP